MTDYTLIHKCRICFSENISDVLKLEPQYIATTFVKNNDDRISKIKIPLTLVLCKECGLVQLKETVNPSLLYTNYFYRTAINDTMKKDLKEVVDYALENVKLNSDDYVMDIGANDCTTISMYPDNLQRIAVEPAKNIDWSNVDKSIKIVNDYFSKDVVLDATKNEKIKVITSTAMFYDFDNPNIAAEDIKQVLDKNGVCVIQVSYLLDTIRDMNFYDVVHEHLEYYSLKSINYLMEKHGLSIIDASTNFVNGGSLRILVTHKENNLDKTPQFKQIWNEEEKWNLEDEKTYELYEKNIQKIILKSKEFIENELSKGGNVIGLGASTKGNVLLQICGIDNKLLPYISDRNVEKVGLFTLGTNMKIISEDESRKMNPTAMLVIPWNFKDEILKREIEYIQNGGKMLFLMPYPYYVDKLGEHKI